MIKLTVVVPIGYYVHIEASWYDKGEFALLESPYMYPTGTCNLQFSYHMSGGSIGSLLVFINSGDNVTLIMNVTGSCGSSSCSNDNSNSNNSIVNPDNSKSQGKRKILRTSGV